MHDNKRNIPVFLVPVNIFDGRIVPSISSGTGYPGWRKNVRAGHSVPLQDIRPAAVLFFTLLVWND
jgi:hypothetical protein